MADGLPLNLPYRAEYAKTGRASCKGCKSTIDKGELKLAFMVQSRFHDGKDATWFHVACFFSKHHPKTVGDISHYESLRWDDQQLIKKKIDAGDGAGVSNGKATKSVLKDYLIGYAKSAKSTCFACDEKIPKGDVRISKKDYEDERAIMFTGGAGLDRWHHLDCFIKIRSELRFFDAAKNIPGFKDLDREDQEMLNKKLPAIKPTPAASAAATGPVKRKNDDKPQEAAGPSSKRTKKEELSSDKKKEEIIRKQNEQMYSYRDALKDYKKAELHQILSTNKQQIPVGFDKLLDRIGDIMTFGALKPCTVCKKGQYVYRSGVGYQCMGDLSEYTKCMNVTQEPGRVPFKVPNDLREEKPYDKYKFKAQKRLMVDHVIPTEAARMEKERKKPTLVKLPLKDFKFKIIGFEKEEVKDLTKKIKEFGGSVNNRKPSSSTSIAAIISTEEDVKKMSKDMTWTKDNGVPVVSVDFVKSLRELNYDLTEEVTKYLICDWVKKDVKTWLTSINKTYEERNVKEKERGDRGNKFEKKLSNVKMIMKGGAVVDPESELEDIGHVLKDGKGFYSFVLNRASIEDGTNSYYKMQIIESDKGKGYWVFRSYGRIGTIIGGKKLDEDLSKDEAIDIFCFQYKEKSGNEWGLPFVKKPGLYDRLEIDFGGEQHLNRLVPSEKSSQLPMAVQELVSLIFDVEQMKQAMLEFELNLDEMPLGKISRKQVLKAYEALTESVNLMETRKVIDVDGQGGNQINRRVLDVSNRFYSMIPHNFGTSAPPLLDNDELIKTKISMLENLLEIELAYELLLEGDKGGESSVDAHFKTLNCDLDVVESRSEEYNMLEKYLKNTHGGTHTSYALELQHIFKVNRKGENKRYRPFKALPNRKLLWHGSRTTNYAGILSQGLRIAPPEAPVTGYMFGKGIYFADMVTKSANYCHPSRDNNTGLLIVCEVALGEIHELKRAKDSLTKAPKDCHSVKGLGQTEPDPSQVLILEDGVEVPMGKPVPSKYKNADLLYNEYIVYDTAQVNIRYLMNVKFNYGTGRR